MRGPSDAELLRDSISDPERFKPIFERHYDSVRRYACRRVGAHTGEDLAAKTFLTAFSVRASFDGRTESARAWLFGIANNEIRHHLRAERSFLAAWDRLPREAVEPDHVDPERLDAIRSGPAIEQALRSLGEVDRETFLLAALGQLTYEEIAVVMSIPVGTVRSKISRVRRLLRERLGPELAMTTRDTEMPTSPEGPA